jgi:hypothetical protein
MKAHHNRTAISVLYPTAAKTALRESLARGNLPLGCGDIDERRHPLFLAKCSVGSH